MSKIVKLKKGFDINLTGKAEKRISDSSQTETFALKPTNFVSMLRPKLLVAEGDTVKAGTPMLYNKMKEDIMYCSPVSGEIVEVKRGAKRKILEIKVLADKEIEYETFPTHNVSEINNLSKDDAKNIMFKGGVWPNLIQRPFGIVANDADTPKAIFISAFDTHPLAADIAYTLNGQDEAFQAGVEILKKFTDGKIHLNHDLEGEVSTIFANVQNVQNNKISGAHPAGNVGVQIHHIDPMNKGEVAWTISPFGVTQIGKLFLNGKYDASRLVAMTGSEVKNPQYYKTYTGACINKMVDGNIKQDHVRYISGNVLTGEKIEANGYLNFYDNSVTVIQEGDYEEAFGWILPTKNKVSFHKAFGLLSFLNNSKKEYVVDTNVHGEKRAFVMTGAFEQVVPMDIYFDYLFKAILAEDFDNMEALGIYELIEEDVAICEFIDVSKHDLQDILREGLTLIQTS